jgi:hypothetical protein
MTVFLNVYGDDGSCADFEEYPDKAIDTYNTMVNSGVQKLTIEEYSKVMDENVKWHAEILEFGLVDRKFFQYIKDEYMDFHRTSHAGFYLISE